MAFDTRIPRLTHLDRQCLAERRERLASCFGAPLALFSGLARVRNFAANFFRFRAESHFLYLVGWSFEQAIISYDGSEWILYLEETSAEEALWHGNSPSFEMLEECLGLSVRAIDDFDPESHQFSTISPVDGTSLNWWEATLDRDLDPPDELQGADLSLAKLLVTQRSYQDAAALVELRDVVALSSRLHQEMMRSSPKAESAAELYGIASRIVYTASHDFSYSPIITQNGEELHAAIAFGKLRQNELILADVGAESPLGWAGDITRTWPANGRFSSAQADIYQAVLNAQNRTLQAIENGVEFTALHHLCLLELGQGLIDLNILKGTAEDRVSDGCVSVFMPHGLGHLLGLDVHDMEDLGELAGIPFGGSRSPRPEAQHLRLQRPLDVGMAFTIEPGFYQIPQLLEQARACPIRSTGIDWQGLERFSEIRGIRIEDDVYLANDGIEVLSHAAPKEISEIEECAHSLK